MELTEHLFRREWGRMVGAVTRIFGVHNLALAEDVVQEAFCRATEAWAYGGVPENPSAWLMATAKNCALDALRRERTARTFAPELGRLLESESTLAPVIEEAFGPNAIKDDLLRMMFSCCHPHLAQEAQVTLMLHILCGFSVDEIASANGFILVHPHVERTVELEAETAIRIVECETRHSQIGENRTDVTDPEIVENRVERGEIGMAERYAIAKTRQPLAGGSYCTGVVVKPY